jgi:hypothetical protein
MKYMIFLILVFGGGSSNALADRNHETTIINNTTINHSTNTEYSGQALALAAAQHSFNSSTFALQWSIGAATYEDTDALSLAIGKRVNGLLLNGSIGIENGSKGAGIGITGTF